MNPCFRAFPVLSVHALFILLLALAHLILLSVRFYLHIRLLFFFYQVCVWPHAGRSQAISSKKTNKRFLQLFAKSVWPQAGRSRAFFFCISVRRGRLNCVEPACMST